MAQTHIEDLARRLTAKSHHALIREANADDRGGATIRNPAPAKVAADARCDGLLVLRTNTGSPHSKWCCATATF